MCFSLSPSFVLLVKCALWYTSMHRRQLNWRILCTFPQNPPSLSWAIGIIDKITVLFSLSCILMKLSETWDFLRRNKILTSLIFPISLKGIFIYSCSLLAFKIVMYQLFFASTIWMVTSYLSCSGLLFGYQIAFLCFIYWQRQYCISHALDHFSLIHSSTQCRPADPAAFVSKI